MATLRCGKFSATRPYSTIYDTDRLIISRPDKNGAAEGPTEKSTGRNPRRGKRLERKAGNVKSKAETMHRSRRKGPQSLSQTITDSLGWGWGNKERRNCSTVFSEAHAPEPYLSPLAPLSNPTAMLKDQEQTEKTEKTPLEQPRNRKLQLPLGGHRILLLFTA